MFKKLHDTLAGLPDAAIVGASCVILAGLGVADYATGELIALDVFYILPIFLVAWFVDRRTGVFLSCGATAVWIVANWNIEKYAIRRDAFVWDLVCELATFLIVSLLFSALRAQMARLDLLSRTDPLTQLANRKAFFQAVDGETNRCQRYGSVFTLAYVDVDNFKSVNDNLGHHSGDEVLRTIAHALRDSVRATDTAARLGGDEFGLLFPETHPQQARLTIEKIRRHLYDTVLDQLKPASLSIGVTTFVEAPVSVDEAIREVDTLMYAVKHQGKNGVLYSTWPATGAANA